MQNITCLNQDGYGDLACLRMGNFASAAASQGLRITRTKTAINRIYADDWGAALNGTGSVPDIRNSIVRTLLTTDHTGGHVRVHSLMGQLKAYNSKWNTEVASAVHGRVELVRASGTMTLGGYGKTAAILGVISNSGAVTVDTNHILAGCAVYSDFDSSLTQTGKVAGYLVDLYDITNWSDASRTRVAFGYGLHIASGAATTGINIGTCTTGVALSGTFTKGINLAGATVTMTDADNCLLSYGTWNDEVDIGTQSAHFVPIQVHMHSTTSAAYDIAAARFRVDTDGANTANAVGCLQLRQQIGDNVASSAILNASVNISSSMAVQTGSLLGGYFSIEGSGTVTKAGSNDCTPLVAVNNNTGGGIDNVFVAMQNGTGTTVTDIVKAVAVHGTATNGINVVASGGSIINGIVVTNATLGVTNSRAIKVSTSTAAAAMDDGYGVVEIDCTMTGTSAGTNHSISALSAWVNIPSGTASAGKYVCAQNNGVYEASAATITNAKIVYGMRAQKILDDTDALSFAFSLNFNSVAHTALIDAPTISDMGGTSGAASSGAYKIPFLRDYAGTIWYANLYTS